jgi:hypothetical protein
MAFYLEPTQPPPFVPDPRLPRMVRFGMRLSNGRIRDERKANVILTSAAVVIFLLAAVFISAL